MPYPDRFYPVGTVQLRAKNLNDADALAIVREALAVTRGTRTKLVVNDYWRAAIEAKAQHLHLGQEDLVDADLEAIRAAGLTLGVSTHDDEELAIGLCRARADLSDHAEVDALRAAGHSQDQRMEEAHRPHSAGCDRRHQVR